MTTGALVLALTGCGGSDPQLASVAGQAITRHDVDTYVDHGLEESNRDNIRPPEPGSDAYRSFERQALAILVARAQIVAAARREGVAVADGEVERRVAFPQKNPVEGLYESVRRNLGIAERSEKGESAALLADAVRVQLTLQKVQARVGPRRLGAWVARARATPVDYSEGWGPR